MGSFFCYQSCRSVGSALPFARTSEAIHNPKAYVFLFC